MATTAATKSTASAPAEPKPPIVIDLGRKRRKRVKQLRKGRGRLLSDVMDQVEDLRDSGEIDADAQAVIVVVRQKRSKGNFGRMGRVFPSW